MGIIQDAVVSGQVREYIAFVSAGKQLAAANLRQQLREQGIELFHDYCGVRWFNVKDQATYRVWAGIGTSGVDVGCNASTEAPQSRANVLTPGTVFVHRGKSTTFSCGDDDKWKEQATGEPLKPFIDKANEILNRPQVTLPTSAKTRNELPMADGCLDYFPLALAYVAHVSWKSTQQHHPDKPMHWDRTKSLDDRNKIMKHLADAGTMDTDGVRHSGKLAWRALANLQKELEAAGWGNPGRASVFPPTTERT